MIPDSTQCVALCLTACGKGMVTVTATAIGGTVLLGTLVRRDDGVWFTSKASRDASINGHHELRTALMALIEARSHLLAHFILTIGENP